MASRETTQWYHRGNGMTVDSKVLGVGKRPVEHYVVRSQEMPARHNLEAQAQDVAFINGFGVGVADFECGDWIGYAVEALVYVRLLLGGTIGQPGGRR
jgi:hypothetical protein